MLAISTQAKIEFEDDKELQAALEAARKEAEQVLEEITYIHNANLMTLVASAQRNDLDVSMYMESAITHMLRGTAKIEDLVPDVWKTHHPEAVRTYRIEERQAKASTALEQAAKRRVRSELRKSMQG